MQILKHMLQQRDLIKMILAKKKRVFFLQEQHNHEYFYIQDCKLYIV